MTATAENSKYDCGDVEKNVQKYLDDRLTKKEKVKFEEHLDNCLPCDKKIEFEVKLKSIMKLKSRESNYPKELEQELKNMLSKD